MGEPYSRPNPTGSQTGPAFGGMESTSKEAPASVGIHLVETKGAEGVLEEVEKEVVDKRKRREGSNKLARELKKLDSSVNFGRKKASKEVVPSTSQC